MRRVERAPALAGRGLDGDRYAAKAGTFTPANDTARGYDLTLIAAEVLDELVLPSGGNIELFVEARSNHTFAVRPERFWSDVGFVSETSSASASACVSRAPTWNASPRRACSAA